MRLLGPMPEKVRLAIHQRMIQFRQQRCEIDEQLNRAPSGLGFGVCHHERPPLSDFA